MKRSLSFAEKLLVTLSAVLVLVLIALAVAVHRSNSAAGSSSEFFSILGVSFTLVLLLGLLAQLASSLRQPVAPREPKLLSAFRQAIQRNARFLFLIALVTLQTALALFLVWIWALTPLEFGRREFPMSAALGAIERENAAMIRLINRDYPHRLAPPHFGFDARTREISAVRWSRREVFERASLIGVLWLVVVVGELAVYIKRRKAQRH